jgi:molecular chaperone GrpE
MTAQTPPDAATPGSPPGPEQEDLTVLRQRIEDVQRATDQARDQLLRKAAEFENYKRRTEAEMLAIIRNATEGLVVALLPVIDDFDRSLKAGREARDFDAFFRGVEMIQNKLLKILESRGLAPFPSVGRPFTVEEHDALLQIPRTDLPPHTVVEEVERGYRFNDRVLRHAKVVVSTAPEPSGVSGDAGPGDDA